MNGHDDKGRFTPGNPYASTGGRRRAETLTPERRRAIAKAGFAALCAQRFGGKRRKCAAWLFDPLGYHTSEDTLSF
jgi:hypothetical protein